MLLHHKALARFTEWFGSGGGVIQTFAVTVLVVVLELAFPVSYTHLTLPTKRIV